MAIDLNDPTTWDVDDKELLEMAKTGAVSTTEEAKTEEPPPAAVVDEAPVLKPAETIPENTPILAADGKNTIPYNVLKDAREEARSARVELQRLQHELEALKAQPVAPPAQAPAPVVESNELPADVRQQIDKIKENWGDDIAAQAERTWRLEQQTFRQQQIIEQLHQQVQQQQQVYQHQQQLQQRSEAEQIEDAIAANAKLDAWAKAEDQGWFDRAVELHAVLMKTDKAYAGLSWHDRMNRLPDKVEALYGASFQKIDAEGAKAKAKSVLDAPPTSLSELSGGSPPERTEVQKLEDLEGNYLTAHMAKLASDPRKFESYLRSVG